MISLSICMIVKNEEDVLERCLNCIKDVADELIIVDTGSTDSTKQIAKQYTSLLYDFIWCDDFSAARNYAFSKATKDYCMWLDADDVLDAANLKMLMEVKALSEDFDMLYLKYDVAFDNNENPTMSYYRERIVRNSATYRFVGAVHEVIPPSGKILYKEISIKHKKIKENPPERNLKIMEKHMKKNEMQSPRDLYYYARELFYNGYYYKAITQFLIFLDSGNGWIENNIDACKNLASCYDATGQKNKALEALFRSFSFDEPRAELCCDIGRHFMEEQKYNLAIFWYELATTRSKNEKGGGFCLPDCYDYIPYLQLCVCYDQLGNHEKANYYNEQAGKLKPEDKSYLYNKDYFSSINTSGISTA